MNTKQDQLNYSCIVGDLETIKALINDPDVDLSGRGNLAIRWAADGGHKEIVELFLTDKCVMDKIDVTLEWCKERGGYELLKSCVDKHKREPDVWELIAQMEKDADMWF